MSKPSIEFDSQSISFRDGSHLLGTQPLAMLDKAYTAFCPSHLKSTPKDNNSYNVLIFGEVLWVIPNEAASRYISGEWAEQLASHGGFFFAESGELPKEWRRRYLLIAKHRYYPKAVVVSRQALPFTRTSERIDPRYLSAYHQRYVTEQLRA